uniref:RBPJ-interacting and tubulin-associated protein 1 n=1 Tax=Varanus komodoensis TaxID=61221 RepID=A0A8D2KU06_VARKO
MAALPLQRRGKGCRLKAKASYVDESLFGSQTGRQSAVTEFDPPWAENKASPQRPLLWSPAATQRERDATPQKGSLPASTPRKRNKYRLKSHTPSYCDETLFGSKPGGQKWEGPGMSDEDVAKLRPLLWTPPSAPRDQANLPLPQKMGQKAANRETPKSWRDEGFGGRNRREDSFWKHPESCKDATNQGISGRGHSQSLTRIYGTSDRIQASVSKPRTSMPQDRHPPAIPTGPLSRSCSRGVSGPSSARMLKVPSACKPKPPWK